MPVRFALPSSPENCADLLTSDLRIQSHVGSLRPQRNGLLGPCGLRRSPLEGGEAVVWLEAADPERALRELVAEIATPEISFDSWLRRELRELFSCDFAQLQRPVTGEFLFAWREAVEEKEEPS